MMLSTNQPDDNPTPPSTKLVILILKDIGDVTWRMAAPILVGVIVGMMLDSHFNISPWGVMVGMLIAIPATVVLVRNLYKKL